MCALPAVIAALPVPAVAISSATLRARILASVSVPYEGYAESTVNLGLPELPDLQDVSTLFDGSTDQYAWYRSPGSWRAAVITGAGESDTYQSGQQTYQWDYGHNVLTRIVGAQPVRLPRAADLLPPALARRLLDIASPADHMSRLPSRRGAGGGRAGTRPACNWCQRIRRRRSGRSTSGPIRLTACRSRLRSLAVARRSPFW